MGLINVRNIDPAKSFPIQQLDAILSREEIAVPARRPGEADPDYRRRLLQVADFSLFRTFLYIFKIQILFSIDLYPKSPCIRRTPIFFFCRLRRQQARSVLKTPTLGRTFILLRGAVEGADLCL